MILRMARRALVALGSAALLGSIIRIRQGGGVPPQSGGWREIGPDELDLTDPST